MVVVILIITLLFSLVVPQLRARTDADLKRSAERLAATIQYVFNQAAFRRETYRLHFDLGQSRYWLDRFIDPEAEAAARAQGTLGKIQDTGGMVEDEGADGTKPHYEVDRTILPHAVDLPEGVRITDVTTQYLDTISEGEAFTHFFPDGYVEPTVIHLADRNKNEYTLYVSPLSGKVKVLPGRLEFEVSMKEDKP
jgi:type II secretory pathway pseudopilin PulG